MDRVIVKGTTEPVELFECENLAHRRIMVKCANATKRPYDNTFRGRFTEARLVG